MSATPEPTSTKRPGNAATFAAVRDWPGYFNAVAGTGPRETLVWALERFGTEQADEPRLAIDLGCGEGRDTVELLRRGWRVLAIDDEPDALRRIETRPDLDGRERLETQRASMESVELPKADLVNASYALPFCRPGSFERLWAQIDNAIRPGGRFSGQLFGETDDWAALDDRTHHTRDEVLELLRPFEIEVLVEEQKAPNPASAYPKRWHMFHVVARKP